MKKTGKNETAILILLLMVMAGYAYYTFALTPLKTQLEELKTTVDQEVVAVETKMSALDGYDEARAELEEIRKDIRRKSAAFYSDEPQEFYFDKTAGLLEKSGLEFDSISVDIGQSLDVMADVYGCADPSSAYWLGADPEAQPEDTGEEAAQAMPYPGSAVSGLSLKGDFRAVLRFCDLLKAENKYSYCDSLSMNFPEKSPDEETEEAVSDPESEESAETGQEKESEAVDIDTQADRNKADTQVYDSLSVYAVKPAGKISTSVIFVTLGGLSSIEDNEDIPGEGEYDPAAEYVIPAEFLDGTFGSKESILNRLSQLMESFGLGTVTDSLLESDVIN